MRIRAPGFAGASSAAMPLLLLIIVGFSMAGYRSLSKAGGFDFRAFYCAGRVALENADPYREHPLHECEQSLPARFLGPIPKALTIPAPFPGYVLVAFAQFARLPFDPALAIWTSGSILALAASIFLVSRSTSTPVLASAIALGLPALILPLQLGQVTLFVLLAIAACAELLRANRAIAATFISLITLIEPHVGLAACLAMFVAIPATRLIFVVSACALLTVNTFVFGPALQWEYVHEVLPAHALVNVAEFSQLSAANIAFTAGLPPKIALEIGEGWYIGALAVGVWAGLRLRARFGEQALLFVPVAFAVFGGTHTHLQQLAFGLPAFLLVTSTSTGRRRRVLAAATYIAVVPWLLTAPFPYLYVAVALLAVAFSRVMKVASIGPALSLGSVIILAVICGVILQSHSQTMPLQSASTNGNPLAEVAWNAFVRANFVPTQAWYIVGKIPTLLAFGFMLSELLRAATVPFETIADERRPAGNRMIEKYDSRALNRSRNV